MIGETGSQQTASSASEQLKRRTEEAANYIDLDRLAISPQCGFASTVAGNPITETDERAKLALVVRAAQAIWR